MLAPLEQLWGSGGSPYAEQNHQLPVANFMREDERYEHGRFDTLKEAIAACERIVDEDLKSLSQIGNQPHQAIRDLQLVRPRPVHSGSAFGQERAPFSAREYARWKVGLNIACAP